MHHIWAEPDWPNFRWDESRLFQPLADLRYKQGFFLGRMSALGPNLSQEALLEILIEDAVQSSAIERVALNPHKVRHFIAQGLGLDQADSGGIGYYNHSVDGIVLVVLDAMRQAQKPLTEERLFAWHGALFQSGHNGFYKIDVAQWRSHPVHITNGSLDPKREKIFYTAPPPERVPQDMKRFLDWFNAETGEDPVIKAGLAHFWFVAVHPFDDGNGRIGRAIMDVALARSDLEGKRYFSVSAAIKSALKDYYSTLEATSNGALDVTIWLIFFLDRVGAAIDLAKASVERILLKARFRQEHSAKGMTLRQQMVINRLLDGFEGKMTSTKWAKLIKASQDTATREILDLIGKGVLRKSAGGGRSTSYDLVLPTRTDAPPDASSAAL